MKVKDVLEPVITLNFVPGVGIFQCVSTGMTITGKRLVWEWRSGRRRLSPRLTLPHIFTEYRLFIMWGLGSEVPVDRNQVTQRHRLRGTGLSSGGSSQRECGEGIIAEQCFRCVRVH